MARYEFEEGEPFVVIERHTSHSIGSFFWGLVAGAGLPPLFAPPSGAGTPVPVEDRVDAARDAVTMRKQQVTRAVHAGRAAAQEAREELERRIAETKAAYQAGAHLARAGRGEHAA